MVHDSPLKDIPAQDQAALPQRHRLDCLVDWKAKWLLASLPISVNVGVILMVTVTLGRLQSQSSPTFWDLAGPRHYLSCNPLREQPHYKNTYIFLFLFVCFVVVIFNACFSTNTVPTTWKTAFIVPIPKRPVISSINDLRPVALTSAVMKVCERVVLCKLEKLVKDYIDPL